MASESILFVEYPRCSTCRKAKKWLDKHGFHYEDRHIVENNPTTDELRTWISSSGLPVRRFFNTSGKLYRELGMKDRFAAGITDEECIELLSSDGMLVKRPVVVGTDFVLVGFREAEWEERLA
jgi:arsenate reductase